MAAAALNLLLVAVVLNSKPPFVIFTGTVESLKQLQQSKAPVVVAGARSASGPKNLAQSSVIKKRVPTARRPETDTSSSDSDVPDAVAPTPPEPVNLEPKPLEKRVAGESTCYDYEETFNTVNSWCTTDAANFRVRIPPNYKKTKAKGPSEASLFHCAGIDIFYSPNKLNDIGGRIQLPPFNFDEHNPNTPKLSAAEMKEMASCNGVPSVFIVNFQIPSYTPSVFSTPGDGPGYSVVYYFVLKPETRKLLEEQSNSAVRLLKRFCEGYKTEGLHGRLKAIPQVVNIDELDLGRVINSALRTYNAKPFLTGPKFHTFHEGEGYLEVDVDIHRFCYPARLLSSQFLPYLPQMVIDVGIVIEGVGDEEQPEQMLGCCRLFKIDHNCAHLTEPCQRPSL